MPREQGPGGDEGRVDGDLQPREKPLARLAQPVDLGERAAQHAGREGPLDHGLG